MIVVADTSPVNYLLIIGEIDLLPMLYQRVLIPTRVHEELLSPDAPAVVSGWAQSLPSWCEVRSPGNDEPVLEAPIHAGERQAILLALEVSAGLLLIDDQAGREEALRQSLKIMGTLGVLTEAAAAGVVDLREVFSRLEQTTFRMTEKFKADFWKRNI